MVTATLNGNKIQSPACYEELATGRFERIFKEWDISEPDLTKRDYFKLFSILTDTNFKGFQQTTEIEATIWNYVRWYVEQPYQFPVEIPKVLLIGEKAIDLPLNIGALGCGQNIYLKQSISKSKFIQENISIAIATYIQPIYDNAKFDSKRVKELQKEIADMPIHITYPIGFFLLNRVIKSGWKPESTWQRILNNLRQNLNRMLPQWLRFRGLVRLMTYQ